jgi:hypothetical protein
MFPSRSGRVKSGASTLRGAAGDVAGPKPHAVCGICDGWVPKVLGERGEIDPPSALVDPLLPGGNRDAGGLAQAEAMRLALPSGRSLEVGEGEPESVWATRGVGDFGHACAVDDGRGHGSLLDCRTRSALRGCAPREIAQDFSAQLQNIASLLRRAKLLLANKNTMGETRMTTSPDTPCTEATTGLAGIGGVTCCNSDGPILTLTALTQEISTHAAPLCP